MQDRGKIRKIYEDLVSRYEEPHRHYHTLSHIGHCLIEFERSGHLAVHPDAILMAILFHDAIYDTKAKDNEEKSAELARTVLRMFFPDEFIERVANLILATKHISPPTDPDAQLITDIDLASLGTPDKVFDENDRKIRDEYRHVPEESYAEARIKILKLFLDRKPIYSTQFFRDKYEAQARKNLERAIAELSK